MKRNSFLEYFKDGDLWFLIGVIFLGAFIVFIVLS